MHDGSISSNIVTVVASSISCWLQLASSTRPGTPTDSYINAHFCRTPGFYFCTLHIFISFILWTLKRSLVEILHIHFKQYAEFYRLELYVSIFWLLTFTALVFFSLTLYILASQHQHITTSLYVKTFFGIKWFLIQANTKQVHPCKSIWVLYYWKLFFVSDTTGTSATWYSATFQN